MFSLWPKPFFSQLRTLTAAFLNFQWKLFCQFWQYGIQNIQRNDWMKLLSYKKFELFYHFRTLNGKFLEFLPENFISVVEIVLGCQGFIYRWVFVLKLCNFFFRFVFCMIQLSFWLNFLRRALQNCTLRARRYFWGKTVDVRIFFNSLNRFRIWAKKSLTFGKNCSAALSKVHLSRQRKKLWELLFWKNVWSLNNFRTLRWIGPYPQGQFLKVPSIFNFFYPKQHFGLK